MRTASWLLVSAVVLCPVAIASAELTEHQAVNQGMSRENLGTLLEARQSAARGRAATAGRWDNPELEYSREQLDLPGGDSTERTLWLRQRINIAGVKGLERDAAAKTLNASMARVRLERRRWRAEIRQRFYTTLAEQQRLGVLSRHRDRLREITTMVAQRIDHGDASRYDGLRVEQELALVSSNHGQARAKTQAAREKLFALVGGQPQPVTGSLIPPAPGTTPVDEILANHPELRALAAESDSAHLDARAAHRAVWPELTIGLGRKELDEPGLKADGNTVSLGIEVPLFDRGSGEARLAEGLAHQRRADAALTAKQLRADLLAARTNLRAQRRAAREIRGSLDAGESSLTGMAESAYRGGEINVMELIDAYRTELTTHQRFIDSALAARHTYIQLQRLQGEP